MFTRKTCVRWYAKYLLHTDKRGIWESQYTLHTLHTTQTTHTTHTRLNRTQGKREMKQGTTSILKSKVPHLYHRRRTYTSQLRGKMSKGSSYICQIESALSNTTRAEQFGLYMALVTFCQTSGSKTSSTLPSYLVTQLLSYLVIQLFSYLVT